MARPGRLLRRRLGRALARPGASPARVAVVVVVGLAAAAVVVTAARLPLLLRARFEARVTALSTQLISAENAATLSFHEAAKVALADGARLAQQWSRDATLPLGAVEVWAEGARIMPPAFGCRPMADAASDVLDAATAVETAALANDAARLERSVRIWLALRANHRVEPGVDLSVTLGPLEAAVKSGLVDPALLRSLLVGGLDVGGSHVPALESQALLALPGACDPSQVDRVARLLLSAGVDDRRLRERLESWRALPTEPPPSGACIWVKGAETFAQVAADDRAVVVRSPLPLQAARAAIAAAGVSSAVRLGDDVRWAPLDAVTARPLALDTLVPERARFDATLRALTVATATLAGGGALLVLVDWRRRRRTDALRRDLIAAVAHELKTPLASMRLQADALERWIADDRAGKTLGRLQEDVDALEGLVENVLSYGRLARGGVVLRETDVSLLELCREVVERAAREQPGLAIELCGEEVVVRADRDLLQLVMGNLVRNAWRHNARPDKRVHVAVERAGKIARVCVTDNGVGIDPAERARIFRPFERSLTLARGSGLGLTLGREIAELHGGDVLLAESGAQGSTFVLELPV